MNTRMRNMTLTAAALAALTVIAPKASAQEHARGGERGNAPRQGAPSYNGGGRFNGNQGSYGGRQGNGPSFDRGGFGSQGRRYSGPGSYGRGYSGSGSYDRGYSGAWGRGSYGGFRGGYGNRFVAPARPYVRYGYGHVAPFRIFSGFRFYSSCPGPGYVYISDIGWALPPFLGAVWVPGYYDEEGFWVDGFWR